MKNEKQGQSDGEFGANSNEMDSAQKRLAERLKDLSFPIPLPDGAPQRDYSKGLTFPYHYSERLLSMLKDLDPPDPK